LNYLSAQRLNICLNICLIVSFKTITVKERVYNKILAMKRKNESFSDLLERLSTRSNLEIMRDLVGSVEFENKEEMLNDLYRKRKERRYG
jgi:predicted CopG family antitoxin